MLFKEIVDGRTDGRTDDGRRTPDIEGSQKLTEHFVLRWAKNQAHHTHNMGSYDISGIKISAPEHNRIFVE